MNGRPSRHTRTQKRGDPFQVGVCRYLDGEVLAYHNIVRVAAHRHLAVVVDVFGIVGKGRALFAELLLVHLAGGAMSAGIDHAADACQIADLEFRDVLADFRHTSGDFVSRNHGVSGVQSLFLLFVPSGMQVAVADAGIQDFNLDVVVADGMTGKFVRMEGVFGGEHGEPFCGYAFGLVLCDGRSEESQRRHGCNYYTFHICLILNYCFLYDAKLGSSMMRHGTCLTDRSTPITGFIASVSV